MFRKVSFRTWLIRRLLLMFTITVTVYSMRHLYIYIRMSSSNQTQSTSQVNEFRKHGLTMPVPSYQKEAVQDETDFDKRHDRRIVIKKIQRGTEVDTETDGTQTVNTLNITKPINQDNADLGVGNDSNQTVNTQDIPKRITQHEAGLDTRLKEMTNISTLDAHEQNNKDEAEINTDLNKINIDIRKKKARHDTKLVKTHSKALVSENVFDGRKLKIQDEVVFDKRPNTMDIVDSHGIHDHSYKNITYYPPDCRRKLLVYVCYPDMICGGLADRQKGIISSFILSIVTNRTFVIDNMAPCNLENVLPPHLYDWTKCRRTLENHVNDTLTIHDFTSGFESPFRFVEKFKRYNGSDLWTEFVVKVRGNVRLHRLMTSNSAVKTGFPWLISKPEKDVIKHTNDLLFKHSAGLSKLLHLIKEYQFRNLYTVCVHLRVGVKQDPIFLTTYDIKYMLEFVGTYLARLKKPYAMYVASDSSVAKHMAKTSIPNAITLNTTIKHIEYATDTTCATTFISVLEQAVLSQCDTILLTRSGYSRLAVLIGGKAKTIFLYNKTNGIGNYTLSSFAELFGYG